MQYIRKGNYATFTFELTNCDGSPVDLSDKTVEFIVKKEKIDSDENAVLHQSYQNSDTNIVSFQFDATQTSPLNEGQYFMAVKIFTENNMNDEVWNDDCKVTRGVFND